MLRIFLRWKLFKENWNPQDVLFISKGSTFPVNMFIKGDFFELHHFDENNIGNVIVKKDLYLKLKNNNFYFSEDLKKWSLAIEFFTGSFRMSINKSIDNTLNLELIADINKR